MQAAHTSLTDGNKILRVPLRAEFAKFPRSNSARPTARRIREIPSYIKSCLDTSEKPNPSHSGPRARHWHSGAPVLTPI